MIYSKNNIFDYFIYILIISLIGGVIGGALQIPRVIAIILSPILIKNIIFLYRQNECRKLIKFFTFFFFYCVISFIWTPDKSYAIKEYFYFTTHIFYLLEFILFSYKANNPIKSTINGWKYFILLTIPIALFEIFTNIHFGMSYFNEDTVINLGGGVFFEKKFASVTFGNYNTYATILSFSFPFLLFPLLYRQKNINEICSYIIILIVTYILITIGSRGALSSIALMFIIFLHTRKRLHVKRNKLITFGVITLVIISIIYYGADIFEQVAARMLRSEVKDESIFEDTGRFKIALSSLEAATNSFFIGNGIGSMSFKLNEFKSPIPASHNLLLEILIQYGLVITLLFLSYFIRTFNYAKRHKNILLKFIIYATLLPLPIMSVINSGYLHFASLWAFLASIIVFKIQNKHIVHLNL